MLDLQVPSAMVQIRAVESPDLDFMEIKILFYSGVRNILKINLDNILTRMQEVNLMGSMHKQKPVQVGARVHRTTQDDQQKTRRK